MSKNDKIQLTASGLKCDAEGCDWRDDTVSANDYEKHLNAPCPKCGANILTEEDYYNCLRLQAVTWFINSLNDEQTKVYNFLHGIADDDTVDAQSKNVIVSFNTHKTIKIDSIRDAD